MSEIKSIESETPAAVAGAAHGSASPEQWWTHHAELLAVKMKLGGVESFRIQKTPRGTYEFEVTPTGWPNEKLSD